MNDLNDRVCKTHAPEALFEAGIPVKKIELICVNKASESHAENDLSY